MYWFLTWYLFGNRSPNLANFRVQDSRQNGDGICQETATESGREIVTTTYFLYQKKKTPKKYPLTLSSTTLSLTVYLKQSQVSNALTIYNLLLVHKGFLYIFLLKLLCINEAFSNCKAQLSSYGCG